MKSDSMVRELKCAEVWGGVCGAELDVQSSGIRASLFAKEGCERRSDVYFFSQCGNGMLTRVALLELKPNETLPVDEMSQWLYNELHDKMNNPDGTAIINDLNKLSNGKNVCSRRRILYRSVRRSLAEVFPAGLAKTVVGSRALPPTTIARPLTTSMSPANS